MREPLHFASDSNPSHDLIILGGGPGGYVAAIRAAQLGMNVALVEAADLGGTCLNWGCIPTKALLKSSQLFYKAQELLQYGIQVSDVIADLGAMVRRSREVAQKLSRGIQGLLKKNKVTVYKGWGHLHGKRGDQFCLQVFPIIHGSSGLDTVPPSLELFAPRVIIASGSRSRTLPFIPSELKVWSAVEAMIPESIPSSLLILGAGAIGIEFASFYNALGTKVTVVEQGPRILLTEDREIADLAMREFEHQGIRFVTQHTVQSLDAAPEGFTAVLKDCSETPIPEAFLSWTGERVLLAIGTLGNTEYMGLEHTQAEIRSTRLVVNAHMETAEPGLYAIGDVTAGPWLAHKASHEGILCVEAMAGLPVHPLDITRIPGCVYSFPQLASIGLNEEQARHLGHTVKVGRFPFMANGQALAQGETVGLIKTLFDANTGELLGAHMLGNGVTELIQGFAIAKTLEATEEDLRHVIFPHPTLSEMMHEAILDADGKALHKG